jgi:hypothetical protein
MTSKTSPLRAPTVAIGWPAGSLTCTPATRKSGVPNRAPILQTLVEGYADRPELGHRARQLVTDATGELSNKYVTDLQHIDLL